MIDLDLSHKEPNALCCKGSCCSPAPCQCTTPRSTS